MKVLLVDDEIEFVNTLSNRLGMRGISTDVVHDGQQALDYVAESEPKLSKTNPNIQVVILTGHGTDQDEEEAQRLSAFDYLRKPVDIATLADRIHGAYKFKAEKTMAAAAFAEAGEFETAKDIAHEADKLQTTGNMFKDEKED